MFSVDLGQPLQLCSLVTNLPLRWIDICPRFDMSLTALSITFHRYRAWRIFFFLIHYHNWETWLSWRKPADLLQALTDRNKKISFLKSLKNHLLAISSITMACIYDLNKTTNPMHYFVLFLVKVNPRGENWLLTKYKFLNNVRTAQNKTYVYYFSGHCMTYQVKTIKGNAHKKYTHISSSKVRSNKA